MVFLWFSTVEPGLLLAPWIIQSIAVIRVTVLTVVLIVSAGPSAPLLCKTWCNPQPAAAGSCHDATPAGSTSIAANGRCDDAGLVTAAVVPEGGQRSVSAPDRHLVVQGPRHLFTNAAIDRGLREHASIQASLEKRPRTTNLRI
jgi:hypothetical protein